MSEFGRVLRFLLAGGANTILTLAAYVALVAAGMPYPLANGCAWTLGLFVSFLMGKIYVFRDRRQPLRRSHAQLLGFAAVHIAGFLLSTGLLMLLVERAGVGSVRAQLVVIPLVAAFNFFCARLFVFKPDSAGASASRNHG